ncbi:AraC family transcriptional regulator [Paenibacillus glycinis]|uniref:Helix-turn-helix domain-containing protein n=1 Tax=Paenibacillus glycinis TaxID=2697035 RepID=A0ABW9Y0E9_9BACL|nr:AraC family transcriptional regulator [Paenibacillus glycinis]NBD28206.1 helix-turn-helix domain-containing protein [Paenibacillus glycinis]
MYEHRYRENSHHGFPDFPFHIYTIEHPGNIHTILPIHWHNEMEFIYMKEGSAVFKIENQDYKITTGEAVIVHPGELHSGVSDDCEGVLFYSIVFKLSWLSSLHRDRIQEQFLIPILSGVSRLPTFLSTHKKEHLELLFYIRQVLSSFACRSLAYEMSLKANMLLFIADSYQFELVESKTISKKRHGQENRQIKHVLAYMEDNSFNKLDLNQLSSIISLSKSHFCKFFKERTGMRPMEYLNFIRINKAATLLRTGSYNVIEASLEAGYQNVSYFSKWFKIYMNMTPSAYKNMYSTGV